MDGLPYVFHNRGTDNNVCSRISQFACNDTMKTRLSFLDQELSVFGYPSIQTSSGLDNVTLINVVHDLLQVYRKSLKNQSDANDNRRCSESDVMRFKQMFYNTKEELAGKISELKSKNMMESQMNQKIDALKMKVKTEQEKTRKMTLEFTSRDSQYKHEKKKLQQEINRLLEKLNKLLQDKKKENFRSFEILNSLKRPDGSRGKWTTDKTKKSNENDMYRIIISNYEDAQSVIIKENEDMRKYLKQMQQEISSALKEKSCNKKQEKKQCNGKQSSTTVHHSDGEDSDYSDDSIEICNGDETTPEELFSMPYDMVKEDIERSLNAKWRALKKQILRHRNPPPSPPDSGKKVDELETIIRQQQEVIDLLTAESEDYNKKQKQKQRSVDMLILEEKAELEKQRTFIEKEKFDLDKERRNYTKALGQLHDDRLQLEKDRCSWLKNHFFQKSPFWREEIIGEKIPSNMKKKNSKKLSDNLSKQQQQQKESKPSPKIKYNPVVVTTECTREADGRSSSSSSSQDSPPPRVFPSVIKSFQQLESNEQEKLIEQAKREGSNFCYEDFCCYLARKREKITERWKSVNLENVGGGGPAINYATDNSLLEEEESTTTTIGSSQLQQLTDDDDDDDDEPVMECTQQARMFTITKSPAHHLNLQPQPAAGIINNTTTDDSDDDDDSSSELATSLPRKYSRPSRRLSFTYDDDDES